MTELGEYGFFDYLAPYYGGHHSGSGPYRTHGHGADPDQRHD